MPLTGDVQERLLEAAGPVFAEKGFEAATVRTICRRAKANLAAVNYYFRDKERLYIEAVKLAHRRRVEQVPLPQWPADTPPEEKLRGFIRMLLTRMVDEQNPPWHNQLMMRELFQPTAACIELVRDFIRPHFEALLWILNELVPTDTPEMKRHLIAFSIVGQCLHYRVARPIVSLLVTKEEFHTYDAAHLAEHIADFTLRALSAETCAGGMSSARLRSRLNAGETA